MPILTLGIRHVTETSLHVAGDIALITHDIAAYERDIRETDASHARP